MKALNYISVITLLALASCTSSLYTGVEYDDLYYLPSDQPVTRARVSGSRQIVENNLQSRDYYDNIYIADTLVSDEYNDAIDYEALSTQGNVSIYNYYDDYSYAGRLNRFHGNYFYPYWRDPFYYGFGYPSMSFGFGYPSYYSNPFYYDPFFSDYGYYGGYYGSYYGGYYGYNPYYSYYSPFSNYGYYSSMYRFNDGYSVPYARRDRQSSMSTRWNSNFPASASDRRDSYVSGNTVDARRSVAGSTNESSSVRRPLSTTVTSDQNPATSRVRTNTEAVNDASSTGDRAATRNAVVSRPDYNSVNRTYTPSYNNPRMSTRPSYNNSRAGTSVNSENSQATTRTNTVRSNTQNVSPAQSRTNNSYSNQRTYTVPSRRSVESSSGFSPGSGSSSSNRSSSSYSSGSSGSGSYSSGSSGSSVSRSSSSGSSSSGSRR